eukprot:577705-Rhodomonas_salina.2
MSSTIPFVHWHLSQRPDVRRNHWCHDDDARKAHAAPRPSAKPYHLGHKEPLAHRDLCGLAVTTALLGHDWQGPGQWAMTVNQP